MGGQEGKRVRRWEGTRAKEREGCRASVSPRALQASGETFAT